MDPQAMRAEAARLLALASGTFWELLGCRLVSIGPEGVAIELDAGPSHLNYIGIGHGGVYASLLDQAMGIAGVAAKPGETIVTTNLNVHYTASSQGGRLLAEAKPIHATRKLLTVEARVTDENGTLCAWGSGTFRVIAPKEEGTK